MFIVEVRIEENPIRTLKEESYDVHDAIFLPGDHLASSSHNSIKIWDIRDGKEICELTGFAETLCLLSNDLLASVSREHSINIWSLKERALVRTLQGHQSYVINMIALPDDKLASVSWDDTIKIWNPYSNKDNLLMTITGHRILYSRARMGILSNYNLATCSCNIKENATVKIWDPVRGQLIKSVSTKLGSSTSMIVLANDQIAVSTQTEHLEESIFIKNRFSRNLFLFNFLPF